MFASSNTTMTRNSGAVKTVAISLILLGWLYTMYKYHGVSEKLENSRQICNRIRKEQEKLSSKLQGKYKANAPHDSLEKMRKYLKDVASYTSLWHKWQYHFIQGHFLIACASFCSQDWKTTPTIQHFSWHFNKCTRKSEKCHVTALKFLSHFTQVNQCLFCWLSFTMFLYCWVSSDFPFCFL